MRIRFKVSIASSEGWSYGPTHEADFSDEQAQAFIDGGIAERVEPQPAAEPSPSSTPSPASDSTDTTTAGDVVAGNAGTVETATAEPSVETATSTPTPAPTRTKPK